MKIIETKFEEEKINSNKTQFIRPDVDKTPTTRQEPAPMLDNIKWPIIGSGATLAAIILITCITLLIKKQSNSELSLKIENNSNPSIRINNSPQQSGMMNPSAPSYNPTFVEKKKQQKTDTKLTLEDGINAIRKIKPEHRTPIHARDLKIYQNELTKLQDGSNSDQRQ